MSDNNNENAVGTGGEGYEPAAVKSETHEIFSGGLPVAQALQKLRSRLLDLSMRNRLLNYKHPKGRSLQFVHAKNLDILYERLIDSKQALLVPVPEPELSDYTDKSSPTKRIEAREHAKSLGVNTSYDLTEPVLDAPASRRGTVVQTLFYPPDLEKLAKKISNEARTVIEETGTNMLYLVFGFLEFYDSDQSEKPLMAPLLAMPVNLVRGEVDSETKVYRYYVQYNGEDITENITLREKLKQEFRLHLPEIGEDETPESYFKNVQTTVKSKRRWTVRRQLSLAMLSFGKLAIWADLDPTRWPGLLKHELLRELFEGSTFGDDEPLHGEDYAIDTHPKGNLPLIYDADSSQHSALIDALSGKNMVINGPPGTGKSQTITNIIAASLEAGKRVLFVSEKLAALEVVRHRLDMANLGHFCLELHSHKTQKKKLLEDIQARLDLKFSPQHQFDAKLGVLAEQKRKLQRHAELMGSKVANELGLTVSEIFWSTERRRQEMVDLDETLQGMNVPNAATFNHNDLEHRKAILDDLAERYRAADGAGVGHPWHGFQVGPLSPGDDLEIRRVVERAHVASKRLTVAMGEIEALGGGQLDLYSLLRMAPEIERIPHPPANLCTTLLASMFPQTDAKGFFSRKMLDQVANILGQVRAWRDAQRLTLRTGIHPSLSDNAQAKSVMSACIGQQSCFGRDVLAASLQSLDSMQRSLVSKIDDFDQVVQTVRPRYENVGSDSLASASDALERLASHHISQTPLASLKQRGQVLRATVNDLRQALEAVNGLATRWRLPFDGSQQAITALANPEGLTELSATADVSDEAMTKARTFAQSPYGDRSVQGLERDDAQLRTLIVSLEQSLNVIVRAANETGQPFDGSQSSITELLALTQIASTAPVHLLPYRRKQFEHPRLMDIVKRARADHAKELQGRNELERDYFLGELPAVDELKWAARVFRQGDGLFNVFKSDWRRAKKLVSSIAQTKNTRKAEELSKECLRVVEWMDHRTGFLNNPDYREWFGELFEGVSTDFEKIESLSAWYQTSQTTLVARGTLVERIDLTELDARKVGQLSARAKVLEETVNTLVSTLEQILVIVPISVAVRSPEQMGWHEVIGGLKACEKEISELLTFFKPLVQPQVAPNRAIELLEAKRDLANYREPLTKLLHGDAAIVTAAGPEFADLAETPAITWGDRLHNIDALIGQIELLGVTLDRFVTNEVAPTDAIRFLSAKVSLDDAIFKIAGATLLSQRGGWSSDIETARTLADHAAKLVMTLRTFAQDGKTVADILDAIQATVEADQALNDLSNDVSVNFLLGMEAIDEDTDIDALNATWAWGASVVETGIPPFAKAALLSTDTERNARVLIAQTQEAVLALDATKINLEELQRFGSFNWNKWMKHRGCDGGKLASDVAHRLQIALDGADLILPWSKYLSTRKDCIDAGFESSITRLEGGQLPPELLSPAFERVFYGSLGKEVFRRFPELAGFSGQSHDRLRAEYMALDKEIIRITGLRIAHSIDKTKVVPQGHTGIKASERTEMHLLRHELGKSRKHVPIRQLMKRAGKSLQALKPCFMMGPLSVAQYLEPGSIEFDVIVMDEASQLRPEDALGAVARGKQLIVVGDPKQLPPTSFFDRMMDGADDDEEEAPASIDGSESILEICQQLFSPVRTLKWHYRSQHESLIAFSNFHFYRNELVVFPSPYERGQKLGVSWKYVRDGIYKDRRNAPEASRIVDSVLDHMIKHPDESLGVVSLNQTQRDLIQDLLDKKLRSFDEAQTFIATWEERGLPFFVKNLENVQGDERDVIFISTTFGKAPGTSKPRQNFGPISRPDGWRRLNVLFTRSKRRLALFSSMQPEDIVIDEKSPAGTRALRDYLDFAKRGILVETDHIDRDPDSDFEVSVANVLRESGYEVKPQLGVANFFIDLVVRNPDRPGEFLAAIECDGATYHSSASARDRDRIRQEILENLGWRGRIWRIWSADWFYNPRKEIQRLLDFLEERRRLSALEAPPSYDEDKLEDEDIVEPEEHIEPAPIQPEISNGEWHQAEDAFVDIGDTITYCFLDSAQQRHQVRISERAINGVPGVISEKAPLATAMLGLEAGEVGILIIKGQPDRKVRVIKIEREKAVIGT